jgi:hypothetical protein
MLDDEEAERVLLDRKRWESLKQRLQIPQVTLEQLQQQGCCQRPMLGVLHSHRRYQKSGY